MGFSLTLRRTSRARRVLVLDGVHSVAPTLRALRGDDIEVAAITFAAEQAIYAASRMLPDAVVINTDATQISDTILRRLTESTPRSRFVLSGDSAAPLATSIADYPWSGELVVVPGRSPGVLAGAIRSGRVQTRLGELTFTPKVITVFAGKGGVGKSTVAVNLAAALAQGCRTLLLDLDLQFGSTNLMAATEVDRTGTMLDLVRADGAIDPRGLADAILDGPGGMSVMYPPINLENSDLVRPAHIRQLIAELRRHFDAIVIDTAPYLEERSLAALDASDDIIIVTSPAVTSAQNARKTIDFLVGTDVPVERIHLVVNQVTARSYTSVAEMQRVIGFSVAALLPHAATEVDMSIAKGRPFVLGSPKSAISRAITQLASSLLPKPAAQYAAGSSSQPADPALAPATTTDSEVNS